MRVSIGYLGQSLDADVEACSASADLDAIALQTRASNMVIGDTNGNLDLFVRDIAADTVTWVTAPNTGSFLPSDDATSVDMTPDGSVIAFASRSAQLVPGDTNSSADIFVWTRATGIRERVSSAWNGLESLGDSSHATISDDGRYVAFQSTATNLVPSGDGNGVPDVYVRDRVFGTTIRASLGAGGLESASPSVRPVVASDGRFVAFETAGALLSADVAGSWKLYRHDLTAGGIERLLVPVNAQPFTSAQSVIAASPNALLVASFASNVVPYDPSGHANLFLVDLAPATARTVCTGFGPLAACPCGNAGGIGHGCSSSVGGGGPRLVRLGRSARGCGHVDARRIDLATHDEHAVPPGHEPPRRGERHGVRRRVALRRGHRGAPRAAHGRGRVGVSRCATRRSADLDDGWRAGRRRHALLPTLVPQQRGLLHECDVRVHERGRGRVRRLTSALRSKRWPTPAAR